MTRSQIRCRLPSLGHRLLEPVLVTILLPAYLFRIMFKQEYFTIAMLFVTAAETLRLHYCDDTIWMIDKAHTCLIA